MNSTPFLIGATVLFWGWQTGLWIPGACMAVISEGSHLIRWKWAFSPRDFHRIADLCTLLLTGTAVYLYASDPNPRTILVIIQWLPMVSFPLLASQLYSTTGKVSMGALFWSLRKARPAEVDITYPFLTGCILSASAARAQTPWFYTGLLVLCAWGLWSVRPRNVPVLLWVILLTAAGILGYSGHVGLHHLQGVVEKKLTAWFSSFIREDIGPLSTRTAVGDLGTLKLSDRIVFRVRTESGRRPPPLLHKASYDVFRVNTWFASGPNFKKFPPAEDGGTWHLARGAHPKDFIRISLPLERGKGLLNLPTGSVEIGAPPSLRLQKNRFGAVKVKEGPPFFRYRVGFIPGTVFDGPFTNADLAVPETFHPALKKILADLQVSPSRPPGEILAIISDFFKKNFSYTLALSTDEHRPKTIDDFLTRSRQGHCEYFATAATLMLRTAGLPARYATGYSVQEFSGWEKRFIVRQRHAHAWTRVYCNGAWHDFDATPPSWFDMERKDASFFEPLLDLLSWGRFKFSEWRGDRPRGPGIKKYLGWLLIPLVLLLIRRLSTQKRVLRQKRGESTALEKPSRKGTDSAFYLIEKTLKAKGYRRDSGETYTAWIDRLEKAETADSLAYRPLRPLIDLHNRYRFDPKGLAEPEKRRLQSGVERWMRQYEKTEQSSSFGNSASRKSMK